MRYCSQSTARVFLCAFLLSPGLLRASLDPAQPIRRFIHQNWQTAQGLPQNSALAIAQTEDGYVWIGSEEGLTRFDGIRFVTFDRHNSTLPNNTVRALLADRKHNLWVGTDGGGLARYKDRQFQTLTTQDGLPSNSIRTLLEDSHGAIWAGTQGNGVARIRRDTVRAYGTADGLADLSIYSLAEDSDGTIWAGTHQGLFRFSGDKWERFIVANVLGAEAVYAACGGKHKDLWVGTNSGLVHITPAGAGRFGEESGLLRSGVQALHEDKTGTLWIGTSRNGLARLAAGKFESYIDKDLIFANEIRAFLEDREGNLWVGIAGHGISCLRRGPFTTFTTEDGLPSDSILPVFEDSEKNLWVGTNRGLAKRSRGEAGFKPVPGIPSELVFSIAEDRFGAIWVAMRHGVARIVAGKVKIYTAMEGLPREPLVCMFVDHNGILWFGSHSGLTRLDGQKVTTFTTADGLSSNFVISLAEDRSGVLWIGTNGGGLNRFSRGRFQAYTTRNGLSSDVVYSTLCDPDGTVWAATNGGGLNRLRNDRIVKLVGAKGLYTGAIMSVLDDAHGHLWMSSNVGVFEVDKAMLNAYADGLSDRVISIRHDTRSGLRNRECNGGFQPAGWRGDDGQLYFPTMGGLATVRPGKSNMNGVHPAILLERAAVSGKSIELEKPQSIPPGHGDLEFQWIAPYFSDPDGLQFRYRLQGFDQDWVYPENRRTAYYTNIPHGTYRFEVQVGRNQVWGNVTRTHAITLEPHFYQTTLFYVAVVVIVLSSGAAAYRIRMDQVFMREQKLKALVDERTFALRESERALRHSRDQLEIRVQERTQELLQSNQALSDEVDTRRRTEEQLRVAKEAAEAANRAKSDFLANMSHEIRTPINGILGMTEMALSTDLDNEQREYLDIVKYSADSLLGIVNEILDFSKIEARKLALDHVPFALPSLVGELIRSLSIRARQKGLLLECRLNPNTPNHLVGDPLRIRQVLLNLLDNAVKFTSEGAVRLRVRCDEIRRSPEPGESKALIHFSVTDSGIGISPEKQKSIFEAFTQADTSSTRKYGGTGLGLTISSQLAAMMGGTLSVESTLGTGSTFHFTAFLPLDSKNENPPDLLSGQPDEDYEVQVA